MTKEAEAEYHGTVHKGHRTSSWFFSETFTDEGMAKWRPERSTPDEQSLVHTGQSIAVY